MEGTVNFTRLLSDDSGQSFVSEDYQTQIYYQLPSSIAARAQQALETPGEVVLPRESVLHGKSNRGSKDKASSQPLRELPLPIQGKREARDRRKLQMQNIGYLESWTRSQNFKNKKVWVHVRGALLAMLPWRHILHTIESRFGLGVKAYFLFLRYLVFLNLMHSLIITAFILGPTAFYGRGNHSEPLRYGGNDTIQDFFLGSGYVNRSAVFYMFYTPESLKSGDCLITPLLFLIGIFTVFVLSLIIGVQRVAVGYKYSWLMGKHYSVNVSYKIFYGWDFMIKDPVIADNEHSFIRNGLKLYLEEQRFHLREAQRTLCQKIRLYLLRTILNLLVLSLLAGAFRLIYVATPEVHSTGDHWLRNLVLQYLPPFVISLINMVLPNVFRKISSFEDYSLTTQVNATLVRSIFLKLASLGIYLLSLLRNEHKGVCWENQFGIAMYKLYTFDFLLCICSWLINYLWKLLLERYPSSRLSQMSGKQRFLIYYDVLDLVYNQTVTWVGVYYCPLLPLLGTVKLMVTFYIKKFILFRCCVPERRMFRGSSSLVLFHFMLMLGFIMAAATLGFKLGSVKPSNCGPFGGMNSVFNVTNMCVGILSDPVKNTVHFLFSEVFAVTLIFSQIVILTFYVSRRNANHRTIERLKNMLVMCSSDKHFLVKQHATMLRQKRMSRKAVSAGTEEDSHGTTLHTPSNELQNVDLVS